MNDALPIALSWLAAAAALAFHWDNRRRWRRMNRKPSPAKAIGPTAAVIEIVEKGRATDGTLGGSVILPNDIRINGQSLAAPADRPIVVHEISTEPDDLVCVTLTLIARRVTIAAEGDL
ncbi:hypothetical protein ACFYVK_35420 [Streptomyces chartreusis]|uniref:hypothetical protein n=1 Tax=Streptomyces chartreusis TaxID=1969 RepID=UPI003697E96F